MKSKWNFLGACCLLFIFCPFSLKAKKSEVDKLLQQILSKASITKSKQIEIPGYPNAYNPSLIPYEDGYLLSFRYISRCPKKFKETFRKKDLSFVGLARLDRDFKVSKKTVQLLNITSYNSNFSLTAEDARLFKVGKRIFIFFNDLPLLQAPGMFAMYFGELIEEKNRFVFKGPAKLLNYPYAIEIEKNWSPFLFGDKLCVIYFNQPQIILEVDLNTGYCQELVHTALTLNWNLGEIRGGTPAYLADDSFLTFFHSSFPAKTPKGVVYVMGAYTFDKDPPFSIRKMTSQPLGDLIDYTENNSSKVVFPGGLVIEDHLIHVAWGKGDKQIFITSFDKESFLTSMELCSIVD